MTQHDPNPPSDPSLCHRAVAARDKRFDGRFFTCVRTTGIFCRPICPARTPAMENCLFVATAAQALAAGFRPCLRCRPEAAPGLGGWLGTAASVNRALALIGEGALDEGSVAALAERLGLGERHLRRLFLHHLGISPGAVAQAQRLLFAKTLISDTALPMTEIALAAGYGSLRRFNHALRTAYGCPPTALRRAKGAAIVGEGGPVLRLAARQPFDWPGLLAFFRQRAVPGLERVEGDTYVRAIAIGAARGVVTIRGSAEGLVVTPSLDRPEGLAALVARLRRVFDLDADIGAIGAHLGADPLLAPLVAARPGLRVPGAWDGFELAVRAILGQQVSVAAATTLAGRLVGAFGEPLTNAPPAGPSRLFPTAARLAEADLGGLGLTTARAKAISGLARAVVETPGLLDPGPDLDSAVARLCRLPGIGPWTAQYIALRALGEADALPVGDIGVLRALAEDGVRPTPAALLARAEDWRPWRSYAVLHLWSMP
ncbi:DNA-3-methyladenine glycosylase 2 family protein [Rhodospirillum rubrum]|uniref:DNA-3-methyladenine glycosylase II n=3 Tax=Rhodospirillum rubrum TaxID=1085 RepID=Q2RNZ4_RHORT|nr:DNA-3-methyladenine glycosylase 2 [Rhodospirillum rubrum]ABC24151.1 Transcriptional regulator Ada / DNA-3-methyladenine glycosylase II / DNA-O6-methylguanine--protein-cysteine S-methyltransferase [Rhodospirillum rubrum ATCC 11170]AEO49902.1 transcriptional regulator Ada / DNA-3-methyladenine glycosylase II / DNA-O6-methylguanine--protein-cysteine S-methyltransferase [Rhodospirillum rubrum F11]MBK5955865.1 3-methyladenine DNA glycosylase 2 [Rhodospirillum rubrum]QXG82452.1 helix-turn-helix do